MADGLSDSATPVADHDSSASACKSRSETCTPSIEAIMVAIKARLDDVEVQIVEHFAEPDRLQPSASGTGPVASAALVG